MLNRRTAHLNICGLSDIIFFHFSPSFWTVERVCPGLDIFLGLVTVPLARAAEGCGIFQCQWQGQQWRGGGWGGGRALFFLTLT